ncbi:mycofactocin biosynthesis peptidyl-dipeptidase MftE [Actinomadura darangshiensis]|uniref:Mycofactocin biosynthesis peptidyl-dipeptidase MftE n=1 Tax=Actinomadura darangshiensis TaxID=705336 RepID=A0A4R5A3P3_9ACTN|nr:mycofactocin biosynthesis peptidyl-dipeptidase MftE [Actinomadura darangshiensis]TDD66493.1 mycofactocin biosynthesis peptidyl-dipeptidase MftE [Actinomadura darangshiensis]
MSRRADVPEGAGRDLAGSAWPGVQAGSQVLVPVGSTEQHGPHLPLSTDTVIAQAVAEGAAARLRAMSGGPVQVAPAIAYGASGEHAGFPGTVSIGHEALHAVIVETVRSLALWAGRVVLVNGHGGNIATLDAAAGRMRAEGHDVAWTGCEAPGGDAHAGFTETSAMLHLAPHLVRPFDTVTGDTRPQAELMPDLVARGVRAVSPSGVLGDPAGASAERGREIVQRMAASAVRLIDGWCPDARGRLRTSDARSGELRP